MMTATTSATREKPNARPVLMFARPTVAESPVTKPTQPDPQRTGRMAVKCLRLERLDPKSVILVEQLLDELIAGWVGG